MDAIRSLSAFAEAHGWAYAETAPPPASVGLWEQVAQGVVRDRVSGEGWEAGRLTGGDRSAESVEQRGGWTVTTRVSISTPEQSIDIGYLALTLPRRLPHMLLDARANGRDRRSRPRAEQQLPLEGDFDSHFSLFVPRGYEQDALYVFTPDLMALLIDETGDLDVEIRDDQLIVSSPGGLALTDPATWERFERIRQTVGAKVWTQTDMYLDDRVPTARLLFEGPAENDIAHEGRRLRGRIPRMLWWGIGIAVVAVVFAGTVVMVVLTSVLR